MQDAIECYKKENKELSTKLESKDKRINLLEGQLRSKEQKYQDDLKNIQRRIAELENQLDNKANTIAYLTSKIQQKNINTQQTTNEYTTDSSGLSNIKKSFSPSPPSLTTNASSSKRRDYQLRRSVVSPSPSKAGVIQDGSKASSSYHNQPQPPLDFVLQNTLSKTRVTAARNNSNKQSMMSSDQNLSLQTSTTRRSEKEIKVMNIHSKQSAKPPPPDYKDFLQISQPEIVQKSVIEPLPPITTRSGRQLRDPAIQTRSHRLNHHRKQAPRATASGEVETVIMDSISSPERTLRRSVHQNSTK